MSGTNTSNRAETPLDRRKLVAVMHADMVGYSRLVGLDDAGTLIRLRTLRRDLIDPAIEEHGGRLVNTGGDSLLVVFDSIDGAVRCAVKMQQEIPVLDSDQPPDRAIRYRIGINLGDAIPDGTDLHGDAVNIAARLQAECPSGGICISRSVWDHVHGRLGLEFEELGPLNLKNIVRPVEAFVLRPAVATPKSVERSLVHGSGEALPLPDKPSIAVLAFDNMSGDPAQEYFSDGIADDIITELSHSPSLFVIARNSSFSYRGRMIDVRQVARELGVRYVLEGSVRHTSTQVRVNVKLIDAASGGNLWVGRYNRAISDLFDLQDQIAEAVALAIEPEVAEIERRRAMRKPPENLSSWEAYQRGLWHTARIGVSENEAARGSFQRAVELDPGFASAWAWLAITITNSFVLYQTCSLRETLDEASPIARRAIWLDPMDAFAHIGIEICHLLNGDRVGALAEAQQALSINPNGAHCHSFQGVTLIYSGQPREGLNAVREGMRLDPYYPLGHMRLLYLQIGYYFLREYDASIEAAAAALRLYPNHPLVMRALAAALGQVGRLDEAKSAFRQAFANNLALLLALKSFDEYVAKFSPWIRREDYEHVLEGLEKAGWQG